MSEQSQTLPLAQAVQGTVNGGLSNSLGAIGTVIAPITLLTALGLYIGWRRTASYAHYFGIDQSVLQYTAQDYLLRSWQSADRVVFSVMLCSIAIMAFHLCVKQVLASNRRRLSRLLQLISYAIVGSSGAVLILSFVPPVSLWIFRITDDIPYVTNNMLVAFTPALLLYFGSLALRARNLQHPRPATGQRVVDTRMITVLAMGLLFLGLLSATDKYVSLLGNADAEYTAATLRDRQGVIVYSKEDLALPKEVLRTELTGPNEAYHYRYEGLRLYTRSGDRYFLLPETWSKVDANTTRADRMIVLRDDQTLRFEFAPGSN